ncbi:MAG: flagellar hook-associated protein FlgK [Alicyclobacillus herbarius]|uniref:flagellar hook-associated protein FlgK n=1 Tax=Alicyclobacillus herbarius TaxID=122960 RepID=UPI00235468B4|nr:flagellar hook-associated protein FlgK [Alicyclobacillus herbarius]MCL6633997.1 flagellar hook-associated protein FlgK [Alicyclobacillus herbarius]
MLGTFLGLEIATRGLQAQQAAIETTAHNIDNANTPGYSRQRVDLTATQPLDVPGLTSAAAGQVGTGVEVSQIQRLRDTYLDSQYREQNQYLGQWQTTSDSLQQISAILNEPSDSGISTAMQNFWNAWDQLATDPSDLSARNLVVQNAVTVAQTLNQTANQLSDLKTDLTTSLNDTVTQVNSYITQIARLNQQIDAVSGSGNQPNDLLDQRDSLLDQLSNLVDIHVQSDASTPFTLSIGGTVVLQDQTVVNDPNNPNQPILHTTGDAANPLSIPVSSGKVKGLLDSLSELDSYQADLNAFANGLANGPATITLAGNWTINAAATGGTAKLPVDVTIGGQTYTAGTPLTTVAADHPELGITFDSAGNATIPQGTQLTVDGLNALEEMGYNQSGAHAPALFVAGTAGTSGAGGTGSGSGSPSGSTDVITAANITVNPAVVSDVTQLAAGLSTNAGDGTLATTVSSLKSAQVQFLDANNPSAAMPLKQGTLDAFLQAVVGQLGVQGQQANQEVSTQQALVQQIDMQRQSVSGVSIDEEMSNLIQYQQSYNASAKVISVINDMLNTLMQNV